MIKELEPKIEYYRKYKGKHELCREMMMNRERFCHVIYIFQKVFPETHYADMLVLLQHYNFDSRTTSERTLR